MQCLLCSCCTVTLCVYLVRLKRTRHRLVLVLLVTPGVNMSCEVAASPPRCVCTLLLCGFACKSHLFAVSAGTCASICMLYGYIHEGGTVCKHPADQFSAPSWLSNLQVCRAFRLSLPYHHFSLLYDPLLSGCGRLWMVGL